ncbi:hypothetical protein ABID52_000390 [Fictibacillus halophilus]|uniref:Heparinase II/III-like C-terminal domain-containing protein n=1 Tax=Fictibacillus halophilus TaxID=1610490 RepID=A0ABV2LDZ6_9BACL|nr:heparinase II/III family protein [Fictibacillus halophilus]
MINQLTSPRLFFTEADLNMIRDRVDNTKPHAANSHYKQIGDHLIQRANLYKNEQKITITYPNAPSIITMNHPLQIKDILNLMNPPGYKEYPFWTQVSLQIKSRLETLTKAFCLTNRKSYKDKAKELLIALCKFTRWYEFPDKGALWSLSLPIFTMAVSYSYDLLYSELTPDEVEIVEEALIEKGLQPLKQLFGAVDQHNIFVAGMSAMMIASLTLHGRREETEVFQKESSRYLAYYLESKLDRKESEGLHYDTVALQHIVSALYANYRITGASLIQHPYLTQEILNQIIYFQGCGNRATFANFSDSYHNLDLTSLLIFLSETCDDPILHDYVQSYGSWSEDLLFHYKKQDSLTVSPDEVLDFPTSKVFQSIGWASIRSGWKENTHMLGFTSSPSERDHNHFDQNNLSINVSGEWLITNPGYQDYVPGPRRDFTLGTVGHNAMLVNGKGQIKRGQSSITEAFISPFYQYVKGTAIDVYEKHLVWNRKIFHIDQSQYIVIDDVDSGEILDLSFLFHSLGHWTDQKKNSYRVYGDHHGLDLQILHPQSASAELKTYPGAEAYGKYTDITVKSNEGPTITWIRPLYGTVEEPTHSFIHLPVSCQTARLLERKTADFPYAYFHSEKINERIEFTFSCEEEGAYFVYYRPYMSAKQGKYEVIVNGRTAATIDGYHEFDVQGSIHDLGRLYLKKGNNSILFIVIEKNEASSNYHMAVSELFIKKEPIHVVDSFQNHSPQPKVVRTDEYVSLKWQEILQSHFFFANLSNCLLTSSSGSVTDAQYLYEDPIRWSCTNGSYLIHREFWLLSQEQCCFSVEKKNSSVTVWITSTAQQELHIVVHGVVQSVTVNESLIEHTMSSELSLVIDKGEHKIQVNL